MAAETNSNSVGSTMYVITKPSSKNYISNTIKLSIHAQASIEQFCSHLIQRLGQELVPGSGIYISSAKLHSIHSQCDKSPKKLYLLLIEAFFSEETLATSLAHGSRTQTSKAAGVLSKALNQDVVKTLKGKGIRQQPIQKNAHKHDQK